MTGGWYNRHGDLIPGTDAPPGSPEWGTGISIANHLLADPEYKILARTAIGSSSAGSFHVSTVWLGLDHRGMGAPSGPPIIFESLVTAPRGTRWDGFMDRYCTEREARDGHDWLVAKIKKELT